MIVRLHDAKRIVGSTELVYNVEGHIDIVTDEQYTESMIISQESYRLDVEWTNRADDHKECGKWTAEVEEKLRKRLREEYAQANNMISWASRASRPLEGEGLIKVEESAESIIKFIRKELGV